MCGRRPGYLRGARDRQADDVGHLRRRSSRPRLRRAVTGSGRGRRRARLACPYDADGFDRFAGMSQDEIDDDRLILADPAAARAKLDQE